VVETILYKRTIAFGTSIDFRNDLRRSEPRSDSGGSGWRKEAVKTGGRIHNITEKTPRSDCQTCDVISALNYDGFDIWVSSICHTLRHAATSGGRRRH